MLGNFFMIFFVVCRNFSTLLFSKYSFKNNIRVLNSLDPDQVIKLFSCSTQLNMKFQLLIKLKIVKKIEFLALKLSDVV